MLDTTANLLIVWHSRTTASQQLAFSAHQGAKKALEQLQSHTRIGVNCIPAEQATTSQLLATDAFLFCAPENLASLSGEMKAFFDRHYYALLNQINGRPYGMIISAGTDGQGAAKQVQRICTGWRLQLVQAPLIVLTGADTAESIWAPKQLTPEQLHQAEELGGVLAAHLSLALD
ncbi:MAG: flavodoxin family protein [Alcaligenaceae bacterium]|nr:flavodoxin family protein [Alcaligenaceae bacterium]